MSPKAGATASNIFPRDGTSSAGSNTYAVVSRPGASSGLNSPDSYFKVFIPSGYASANVPVTIRDACVDLTGDQNTGGTAGIKVRALQTTPSRTPGAIIAVTGPSGSSQPNPDGAGFLFNRFYGGHFSSNACNAGGDLIINVPRSAFNQAQAGRYGTTFRTAIINVRKESTQGEKSFKLITPAASGTKVSFDDLGADPADGASSVGPAIPGGNSFAIQDVRDTSGSNGGLENSFSFTFRPDCNYNPALPVYLKWSDADVGAGNESGDIEWELRRVSDNALINSRSSNMGGSGPGSERSDSVGTLALNTDYIWTWKNVDRSNGVQLWMPFSEVSQPPCPNPPANAAVCAASIPSPTPGTSTGVQAGTNFTLRVRWTNMGNQYQESLNSSNNHGYGVQFYNPPWPSGGPAWGWGSPGTLRTQSIPNTVGGGQFTDINFAFPAPNAYGSYTFTFYTNKFGTPSSAGNNPAIADLPLAVTACSVTVWVASVFQLQSSAPPPLLDNEDPTVVSFSSNSGSVTASGISGWVIGRSSRALLIRKVSGAVIAVAPSPASGQPAFTLPPNGPAPPLGYAPDGPRTWVNGTINYPAYTYTVPPGSLQAGDRVCNQVNADIIGDGPHVLNAYGAGISRGSFGAGGSYYVGSAGRAESCVTIVNKPYFGVEGAAVSAGGNFASGGVCTGGGTLASWNNNQSYGDQFGAGTNLSALSNSKDIIGFGSAQRKSPPPSPLGAYLSFANKGVGGPASPKVAPGVDNSSPFLGGKFGSPLCFTDPEPAVSTPVTPNPGTPVNVGSLAAGAHRFSGNMTFYGTTDKNVSIIVDGKVHISSDITYSGSGGWSINTTSSNVPRLSITARGGNIYIDPGVGQLDGTYISKPFMGSGGTIYTCSDATGYNFMATANLYASCKKQLLVYGSFVAKQVNLMRTFGSLRNARGAYDPGTLCSNSAVNPFLGPGTCAAEIFRFSPEMYLSDDPGATGGGIPPFEAITSLPPVL